MEFIYNVNLTERAKADIDKITTYLSDVWSEKVKMDFLIDLTNELLLLEKMPFMYKKSLKKHNVRECVINKHYLMFYKITGEEVEILTIQSSKQNPKKVKL